MFFEKSMIFLMNGTVVIDFMPAIFIEWLELRFRGVTNDREMVVKCDNPRAIVRGYAFCQYDIEDTRSTPRWSVGQCDHVLCWHVWCDESAKPMNSPMTQGLNVILITSDWGKGEDGLGRVMYSAHIDSSFRLTKEDITCLEKLQKADDLYSTALEQKIGILVQDFVICENWLELKRAQYAWGGVQPSFSVPQPQLSMKKTRRIVMAVEEESRLRLKHQLFSERFEEEQKLLAFCAQVKKEHLNPYGNMTRLMQLEWDAWPYHSSAYNGLLRHLFREVVALLKKTVRHTGEMDE